MQEGYSRKDSIALSERRKRRYLDKSTITICRFLKDFRTDLGKKKNAHNGTGGTYDAIAIFAYYVVCKEKTNLRELEEMPTMCNPD